jgi:hypothetical protein
MEAPLKDMSFTMQMPRLRNEAKFTLKLWLISLLIGCNTAVLSAGAQENSPTNSEYFNSSQPVQELNPFTGVEVVLFVLDCSKDMDGQIRAKGKKSTQFDQAKFVLSEVIKRLPPRTRCGLRVFGSNDPMGPFNCQDTTLLIEPNFKKNQIQIELTTLKPMGWSPILYSLSKSEVDLSNDKNTLIVLLTSGNDSCGGIVEDYVRMLKTHKSSLTKVVVYSTAPDSTCAPKSEKLRPVADATDGKYYNAETLNSLLKDVETAAKFKSHSQ